jgi:hypothetical protein
MIKDLRFGVFQDDNSGPLWRASLGDIEEAKRLAQKLAASDRLEFFVYSFETYSEVARSFPYGGQTSAG